METEVITVLIKLSHASDNNITPTENKNCL